MLGNDLDRFYRNPTKFNLLLQRLRSKDEVVKYRNSSITSTSSSSSSSSRSKDSSRTKNGTNSTGTSTTGRSQSRSSKRKKKEDTTTTDLTTTTGSTVDTLIKISDIQFLNDPSTDNDTAAGELGDALQIQLQNVLSLSTLSSSSSSSSVVLDDVNQDNNIVIEVVNHLDIVIENMTTNFHKYQSLLQYISTNQNNNNPYLESLTIHAQNPYNGHSIDTDTRMIQQQILSEFMCALLPVPVPEPVIPVQPLVPNKATPSTTGDTIQLSTHNATNNNKNNNNNNNKNKLGLQRLVISGFHSINLSKFVTFIQNMDIPILEMDCLSFLPTQQQDDEINSTGSSSSDDVQCDIHQLSDAFQNNKSIQELYLEIDTRTIPYISKVFKQLMYNTTLRRLRLEWSIYDFLQYDDDGPIAESYIQEFILTLTQYFNKTQSLHEIELIQFQFIESEILRYLLTSISSNPSIQVLTLNQCSFDRYNSENVLNPIFPNIKVRRLEMLPGLEINSSNDPNFTYLIHRVLPTNMYIEELCILSELLPSSSSSSGSTGSTGSSTNIRCSKQYQESQVFLKSYLQRNRGIQQLIQQYAKTMMMMTTSTTTTNNNNTTGVHVSISSTETTTNHHHHHRILDMNHHSFQVNEPRHVTMQKQRRLDHQYYNNNNNHTQQAPMIIKNNNNNNNNNNNVDSEKDNDNNNEANAMMIPIELIPTILANHFPTSSSNRYGPTIIYHLLSNLGHHHHY